MNIQRFTSLPTALKPAVLFLTLMAMLMAVAAPATQREASLDGAWFFWLNIILQLVFTCTIMGLFLYEAEAFLTCGRDSWPVLEMSYSGVFAGCNLINTFMLANWQKYLEKSSSYFLAAVCTFLLLILYALGGAMMYRLWRGLVRSGASQNPTNNVQPGNVGSMHPGV